MHQHATLEDTVYLWFGANDTSGSGGDGATPVYDVRLGGAAADAIPVLSGSATLLSHANYPAGAHEVAVAATAGNGFAAGNTYGVFCTLLVDSQNPTGFVGSFTLGPVPADMTTWLGVAPLALSSQQVQAVVPDTQKVDIETIKTKTVTCGANVTVYAKVGAANALTVSANGEASADLTFIHGTALTETIAGYLAAAFVKLFDVVTPVLVASTVMRGTDSAALATVCTEARLAELAAANLPADVDTINTNAARLTAVRAAVLTDLIDGGRLDKLIDAVKVVTDALTSAAATKLALSAGTIVTGAAAAGTLSTTQMSTDLSEATDDHYNGRIIIWTSGVLQNQATDITDYENTDGVLTYTAVTEAPSAADTFIIL